MTAGPYTATITLTDRRDRRFGWLMASPSLALLFLVILFPVFWAFFTSLHDYTLIAPNFDTFTGTGNFIKAAEDGEFRHSLGRDFDRAMRRARACDDQVELPEQNIAIDGQRRRQAKRADAPNRVSRDRRCFVRSKHLGFTAQHRFDLAVIQSRVAAGDEHNTALADPE